MNVDDQLEVITAGELPFAVHVPSFTRDRDAVLEIARQRNRWRMAFETHDVNAMMRFYALDIYSYDLMAAEEDGRKLLAFDGEAIWRQNWIDFFIMFEPGLKVSIENLTVYQDGDLATVRGLTRLDGITAAGPIDMWARETNVLRCIGGTWLVIHDHVSVPLDFATGKALLDLGPDRY